MAGLRFGSVCSGIEAASVAWEPLGFTPAWLAEIEAFPNAVLAHHWPTVTNLGDITSADFIERAGRLGHIDILVGGTPCQGFSHAGHRKGIKDPRSALAMRFIETARTLRPEWVVWENVPGCLTTAGGRDFGTFVGQVAECGYRWAYRVCDAQFFGVPQRRRRVFLVGHLGAGRPENVLFEPQGEGRHPAAGGEAQPSAAGTVAPGVGGVIPLDMRQASRGATMTNNRPAGSSGGAPGTGIGNAGDPCPCLSQSHPPAVVFNVQAPYSEGRGPHCQEARITKCLDSHGLNPNCQQGGSLVMAVQESQSGYRLSDTFATLDANYGSRRHNGVVTTLGDKTHALTAEGADASEDGTGRGQPIIADESLVVRRLTPLECERLMGFPDNHTLVTYRKKPAADGPRYKALGNSIAIPVLRWIGSRLLAESNTERLPAEVA